MIIINGKVIGQIISNGNVVTNDQSDTQMVDITKTETAYSTLFLSISSQVAHINISKWDNDNIQARLHGKFSKNRKISLNMSKANKKVKISVDLDNSNYSFCLSDSLELDIQVPRKFFEEVTVKSNIVGNICLKSISASIVTASCVNGNVSSFILPENLTLSTKNGNIHLSARATQTSHLELNSTNGNISVKLDNVARSKVVTSSQNGSCKTKLTSIDCVHTVTGSISTKNGNISFEY